MAPPAQVDGLKRGGLHRPSDRKESQGLKREVNEVEQPRFHVRVASRFMQAMPRPRAAQTVVGRQPLAAVGPRNLRVC